MSILINSPNVLSLNQTTSSQLCTESLDFKQVKLQNKADELMDVVQLNNVDYNNSTNNLVG